MVSLGYDNLGMGHEVGFGGGKGQEIVADWAAGPGGEYCRVCRQDGQDGEKKEPKEQKRDLIFESIGKGGDMDVVAVPFVFRLLVAELASMGIKITVGIE